MSHIPPPPQSPDTAGGAGGVVGLGGGRWHLMHAENDNWQRQRGEKFLKLDSKNAIGLRDWTFATYELYWSHSLKKGRHGGGVVVSTVPSQQEGP